MSGLLRSQQLHDADDWFDEPGQPALVDDLFDAMRGRVAPRRVGALEVLLAVGVVAAVVALVAFAWMAVFAAVVVAKWALVAVWPVPAALAAVCAVVGR